MLTALVRLAVPALVAMALLSASSAGALAGKGHGHRGGHGHHHHHHHHGHSGIGISFGFPALSLNFGSPRPVYVPPPVVYRPYPYYYPGVRYVVAPPAGYTVLTYGGVRYCYHDGIYYRPVVYEDRTVYQVVEAPAAAATTTAPPPQVAASASSSSASPESVVVNGTTYYRDGGQFYQKTNTASSAPSIASAEPAKLPRPEIDAAEYQAVPAPIGATLDALPSGAQSVDVNGTRYYQSGETFYLPIRVADAQKYVVVTKPQ